MHKLIIITLITYLFFGCAKPTVLKTIDWNGNTITLSELDAGATGAFYWKIYYSYKNNSKKKLIFESYSLLVIENISIDNNNLLIHCLEKNNKTEFVTINLDNINYFIDTPIKYDYYNLKTSNKFYKEPTFIKNRH